MTSHVKGVEIGLPKCVHFHVSRSTPDIAHCDVNRHRLNGLALQRAELARQVAQEMVAGFTAHKTREKGLMKLIELVDKSLHIGARKVKMRLDIWVLLGATSG